MPKDTIKSDKVGKIAQEFAELLVLIIDAIYLKEAKDNPIKPNETKQNNSKKIIVSQLARCRIPSLIILHSKFKTTLKRRKVWITPTPMVSPL